MQACQAGALGWGDGGALP